MTSAASFLRGFPLAVLLACAAGSRPAGAGESAAALVEASAAVTPLVRGPGGIGGIAVKPNGQSVLLIDGSDRSISMIDLADPGRRQPAVGVFPQGEVPESIACIDSITTAVLVRSGRRWSVRVYRLGPPGTPVEATAPLQTIQVGESAADSVGRAVTIMVSPSRNWLVIAGLPEPLSPLLRAAIAGARVGGLSTRNCPEREKDGDPIRPVAVAVSPLDEPVLFDPENPPATGSVLSMYSTVGARRLLELETGLRGIVAAFHSQDALWALAGEPGNERMPEGLWRLDAVVVKRRQAVRPVCVATFDSPIAIAGLSDQHLLVVHGPDGGTISRVDPRSATAAASRRTDPGKE